MLCLKSFGRLNPELLCADSRMTSRWRENGVQFWVYNIIIYYLGLQSSPAMWWHFLVMAALSDCDIAAIYAQILDSLKIRRDHLSSLNHDLLFVRLFGHKLLQKIHGYFVAAQQNLSRCLYNFYIHKQMNGVNTNAWTNAKYVASNGKTNQDVCDPVPSSPTSMPSRISHS